MQLSVWDACEINSIIIAACIPTLAPLYRVLRGRQSARNRYLNSVRDATPPLTISSRSRFAGLHSVESRTTSLGPSGKAIACTELEENRDMRASALGSGQGRESEEGLINANGANSIA